jgi:hypothetical protein
MRKFQLARSFVRWGGFYTPPSPSTLTIEEKQSLNATSSTPDSPLPEFKRKRLEEYKKEWDPRIAAEAAKWGKELPKEPKFSIQMPKDPSEPQPEPKESEQGEPPQPERPAIQMIRPAKPEEMQSTVESVETTPATTRTNTLAKQAVSKKRERLLELARKNARAPLPEPVQAIISGEAEPDQLRTTAEEKVDEEQLKNTVRERLWKLMSGKWT